MISKFLNIWWTQWTWPLKLVSAAAVLVLLLLPFLLLRGCGGSPVIDQEQINKINSANEKERKAELQKVIEDNQETISTVDNRTTIAETNVVERNRLIDEKIKEVDKKIAEAKHQGRDVTAQELECLLTGNCS
jgi:Co/Zn/Cd efflux system component